MKSSNEKKDENSVGSRSTDTPNDSLSDISTPPITIDTYPPAIFPLPLVNYFKHSKKYVCVDSHSLLGYDGLGLFHLLDDINLDQINTPGFESSGFRQNSFFEILTMDDLRRKNHSKQYHYIFSINQDENRKYFLSTQITESTQIILSYYTNTRVDWSINKLYFIKKFCSQTGAKIFDKKDEKKSEKCTENSTLGTTFYGVDREDSEKCKVFPDGVLKIIGIDTQFDSYARGYSIYKEQEDKMSESLILHKSTDDEVVEFLNFLREREIVLFISGDTIIRLFLKREKNDEDLIEKHTAALKEYLCAKESLNLTRINNKSDKSAIYTAYTFFIPPGSVIVPIAHSNLTDYNKIQHYHSLLLTRHITVKKIVKKVEFRDLKCSKFDLSTSEDDKLNRYVLVRVRNGSLDVKIFTDEDFPFISHHTGYKYLLHRVQANMTDYVVLANVERLSESMGVRGLPFLVYFEQKQVIKKFFECDKGYKESMDFNLECVSRIKHHRVTYGMLRLWLNTPKRLLTVENNAIREANENEEVRCGDIVLIES